MPISNGRYVSPTWINNQAPPINASELQAITDTLETLNGIGGSGRGYIIVGTTQSGATLSTCDYLCDGTADDVEINAAIDYASDNNLSVLLLSGTYNITSVLKVTVPLSGISSGNTILQRSSNEFQTLISLSSSLSDIRTSGTGVESNPTCIDIYLWNKAYMNNVSIYDSPGIPFATETSSDYLSSYSSVYLSNVYISSTLGTLPCVLQAVNLNSFIINSQISVGITLKQCGGPDGGFSIFNSNLGPITIQDCEGCVISNNNLMPSGSISVQYQSNSFGYLCASNIITSNLIPSGITLGEGTQYNIVTSNGGIKTGVAPSYWLGVTDNGTNNYVANNMPTS